MPELPSWFRPRAVAGLCEEAASTSSNEIIRIIHSIWLISRALHPGSSCAVCYLRPLGWRWWGPAGVLRTANASLSPMDVPSPRPVGLS